MKLKYLIPYKLYESNSGSNYYALIHTDNVEYTDYDLILTDKQQLSSKIIQLMNDYEYNDLPKEINGVNDIIIYTNEDDIEEEDYDRSGDGSRIQAIALDPNKYTIICLQTNTNTTSIFSEHDDLESALSELEEEVNNENADYSDASKYNGETKFKSDSDGYGEYFIYEIVPPMGKSL